MPETTSITPSIEENSAVISVEVYMPKRLAHLSELYRFLRESVQNRRGSIVLNGFTIYEADGAFWDEGLFEERTLVIRFLLVKTCWQDEVAQAKINEIGRILAEDIAPQQRQIWITVLSGHLAVFKGASGDEIPLPPFSKGEEVN